MDADKSRKLDNVIAAIEAFTDAKIEYHKRYAREPEWVNSHDVDETREHLREKLTELMEH